MLVLSCSNTELQTPDPEQQGGFVWDGSESPLQQSAVNEGGGQNKREEKANQQTVYLRLSLVAARQQLEEEQIELQGFTEELEGLLLSPVGCSCDL